MAQALEHWKGVGVLAAAAVAPALMANQTDWHQHMAPQAVAAAMEHVKVALRCPAAGAGPLAMAEGAAALRGVEEERTP